MEVQNIDIFMLLCRVQLFLFGVIFTAGSQVVKHQCAIHGRISCIRATCKERHSTDGKEKKE